MDPHGAAATKPRKVSASFASRSAPHKRLSHTAPSLAAATATVTDAECELHTYTLCLLGYLQHFSYSNTGTIKEIPMQLDSAVRQVSCGLDWLCVLTERGRALSFGSNTYGQLAQGHTHAVAHPRPVLFAVDKRIVRIACGAAHGGFLVDGGALFMFGCGTYGRLGTGNDKAQSTPVAVKMRWSELSAKAKALGTEVSSIPGVQATTTTASSLPGGEANPGDSADEIDEVAFVDISCGDRHTLLLGARAAASGGGPKKAAKNGVIAFGDGMNGRLGLGSERDQLTGAVLTQFKTSVAAYTPHVVAIHAGASHNAAVSSAGELFTWGNGADGQLGHGSNESEWVPREVAFFRGISVAAAKCGAKHTAAVSRAGTVYTWGRGLEGQLGTGGIASATLPQRVTPVVDPVAAQQAHIDATLAAGASFSASSSSSSSGLVAQDMRVLVRSIVAKDNTVLALDEQSRLFVWGDNAAGQLGLAPDTAAFSGIPTTGLHAFQPPQTRVTAPRHLSYMELREPKKLASRVRDRVFAAAASTSLPRVALTHVEASDRFSLLVFRTKAAANALAHGLLEGHAAAAASSSLSSVGSLTQQLMRKRSSLQHFVDGATRWELSPSEPLQISDVPSREAAFYNYMAQYKVIIRAPTPPLEEEDDDDDGDRATARAVAYHGKRRSSVVGIPPEIKAQLKPHVRHTDSDDDDDDEYVYDASAARDRCGSPRATRPAAEAVKGFSAWLDRHGSSPARSPAKQAHERPVYQFGTAPRFRYAQITDATAPAARKENEASDSAATATAPPPSPPKPATARCRPRPPRSAFGRSPLASALASVSASASAPRRPTTATATTATTAAKKSGTTTAPSASPPPSRENRQRLINQFVAPFGSSVGDRFGLRSPRANDGVQLDLHPEACDGAVFARSPTASLSGNAEQFSAVIARRLGHARGALPGPGTYDRNRG